nr:hypothetical protein [uncultured Faecalibacillus sp.]
MKDIDEMTDTIELLKKGIKKQLESAIVTLQLIKLILLKILDILM